MRYYSLVVLASGLVATGPGSGEGIFAGSPAAKSKTSPKQKDPWAGTYTLFQAATGDWSKWLPRSWKLTRTADGYTLEQAGGGRGFPHFLVEGRPGVLKEKGGFGEIHLGKFEGPGGSEVMLRVRGFGALKKGYLVRERTGSIKADVRGVLRFEEGTGYYIAVRSATSGKESRVWLRVTEDKALVGKLEGLTGKDVVASGELGQMPAESRGSVPANALYFRRFEIKAGGAGD